MMPILFLLFSQAAVGGLTFLYLAPQAAGQTFFRMMGGFFLILALLGLLAAAGGGMVAEFISFSLFTLSLLAYEVFLFRENQMVARLLYFLALALGIIALLSSSAAYTQSALGIPLILYPLNFLATAIIMGAVIMGLALGHWYLAAYKMPLEPLKRVVQILIISALGLGLINIWLALGGGQFPQYASTDPESARQLILVVGRMIFGILAPAFLGVMVWDVLRYRKTTSATGIFYVALAMVIAGELSARYLLVTSGVPW